MSNIFSTVTIEQFKEYYFRDFPFLPYYLGYKSYKTGDIVFYNDNFYKSLTNNNTAEPTDTENWQVTTGDKYSYVTDEDIAKAMTQAQMNANERFGSTCNEKIYIYLHLVAFYLVMDLKNASAGINSAYSGLVASKSVGDVSESYNFPQWVVNSPLYSIYSQNGYGMKYLSLIIPYLSVTIMFSQGRTTFG